MLPFFIVVYGYRRICYISIFMFSYRLHIYFDAVPHTGHYAQKCDLELLTISLDPSTHRFWMAIPFSKIMNN